MEIYDTLAKCKQTTVNAVEDDNNEIKVVVEEVKQVVYSGRGEDYIKATVAGNCLCKQQVGGFL